MAVFAVNNMNIYHDIQMWMIDRRSNQVSTSAEQLSIKNKIFVHK